MRNIYLTYPPYFRISKDNIFRSIAEYSRATVTRMHNNSITPVTSATFPVIISNMGGLHGLCMGFSFVSVVEVVFYLVQFICSGGKERE